MYSLRYIPPSFLETVLFVINSFAISLSLMSLRGIDNEVTIVQNNAMASVAMM